MLEPRPGPGQVRIRVRACGVNFADSLITRGQYQVQPKPPFSPGFEVAGEVLELGAGVEGLAVGDRVIAMTPHGGYAEQVVASASRCVAMPAAMPDAHGAAFPVVFGTSHVALWHRARLQAGETLVVHGAGGGVGLTAVAIGKRLGATVIATASGTEKLAVAAEHGRTRPSRCRPRGRAGADRNDRWPWRGCSVRSGRRRVVHLAAQHRFRGTDSGHWFCRRHHCRRSPPIICWSRTSMSSVSIGQPARAQPRVVTESFQILLQWYLEGALNLTCRRSTPWIRATDAGIG
ncbi:MAG: alcohol dehydrogenase catalytic domain-containing protein [Candidatus Competibacteraceae bacterium]